MKKAFAFTILCLSLLLAGCSKEYVCADGTTASSREDCPGYGLYVTDYVLTLEDMPDDYLVDVEETGLQAGSEVTRDDLERGWKEGYFCGFVDVDPETDEVRGGVYCLVSRYDKAGLAGILETGENLTRFEAPSVGDTSIAYHSYDAEQDLSSYFIEFVKGDVYAVVSVRQKGEADLRKDTVKYAGIIASRIP